MPPAAASLRLEIETLHDTNLIPFNDTVRAADKLLSTACNKVTVDMKNCPDTSDGVLVTGRGQMEEMGLWVSNLQKSQTWTYTAKGSSMQILGFMPVKVSARDIKGDKHQAYECLYFADGVGDTLISLETLKDLGCIPRHWLLPAPNALWGGEEETVTSNSNPFTKFSKIGGVISRRARYSNPFTKGGGEEEMVTSNSDPLTKFSKIEGITSRRARYDTDTDSSDNRCTKLSEVKGIVSGKARYNNNTTSEDDFLSTNNPDYLEEIHIDKDCPGETDSELPHLEGNNVGEGYYIKLSEVNRVPTIEDLLEEINDRLDQISNLVRSNTGQPSPHINKLSKQDKVSNIGMEEAYRFNEGIDSEIIKMLNINRMLRELEGQTHRNRTSMRIEHWSWKTSTSRGSV